MIIVYTASNKMGARGNLIKEFLKSFRSLETAYDGVAPFTQLDLTPPYPKIDLEYQLEDTSCLVKLRQNETNSFFLTSSKLGRYGEKIFTLSRLEFWDNVVFLDCDTRVNSKLNPLFKGEFDIACRIASGFEHINYDTWSSMFHRYNKEPIPMINAGVMVFKNSETRRKIMREALAFLGVDLPQCSDRYYHKDQYALSLAISNPEIKIKWLSPREHSYNWKYEKKGLVSHGERLPLKKAIRNLIGAVKIYVSS